MAQMVSCLICGLIIRFGRKPAKLVICDACKRGTSGNARKGDKNAN